MEITIGSLFDGIGGFPLAGQRNGMKAIWASEIEPFPIKVTKIRFPEMRHIGDITKINGTEIEPVSIITGGSPCQDLSIAGKRAGLAGKRSGLFMEQVRVVREMREHDKRIGRTGINIRPRFMVWENVPGAFSSNFGEDFWAVLEETAKIADETITISEPAKKWDKKAGRWRYIWNTAGCIMGDGWSIAWRVLDAQFWGVPQRRRRIYLVADFGGESAPEILFKREGLRRHLAEGGEAREGTAGSVEGSTPKTMLIRCGCRGGGKGALIQDNKSATLSCNNVQTLFDPQKTKVAAFCAGASPSAGNIGYQEEVSPTLKAVGGLNRTPALILPFDTTQITSPENGNNPHYGDPCHPLAVGAHPPAIIKQSYQDKTGPLMANSHPGSYTGQDAYNDMLVAGCDFRNDKENGDLCGTLQAKPNGGFSYNCIHPVRIGYSVRRLIPLECDRLQDYPDDWTNIPGASDSARYKADGNGIAVCCAEYVLEGIKEVLAS